MIERILVPLDGSELSERAVPMALEIGGKFGSDIILVRVMEPMRDIVGLDLAGAEELGRETTQKLFEQYLEGWREQIESRGLLTRTHVDSGEVAGAILDRAVDDNADLIVMSSHGRSGLSRWAFGSVAEKVVRHAACPTLVVPARYHGEER